MSGRRNNAFVDGIVIRVEYGLLSIPSRKVGPELCSASLAAGTNMESDNLTGGGVHGNPDPVPVRPLPDEAPELVHFSPQLLQDHHRST